MQIDNLLFFVTIICCGYFIAKLKLVPKETTEVLPAVLTNICYPAMILDTFISIDLQTLTQAGLPVVVGTLIVTLILFLLSFLLFRRVPSNQRPLLQFIIGVGNVTYVAIPLMSVFLPEDMMVAAILHGSVQDLLIWSIYHQLFVGYEDIRSSKRIKKIFSNPCLIAVVLGVSLLLLKIKLPSFMQLAIGKINAVTSPVALLFLGILIHNYGLFSWKTDIIAITYSICKVVLLPLFIVLIGHVLLPISTTICLALLFGSPAPLTSVVWCKQYQKDDLLAVNCCISSTILFLLFMSISLFYLTGTSLI